MVLFKYINSFKLNNYMVKESFEVLSSNNSESEPNSPESEKLVLEEVLKKVGQIKNILNFYSEKKMIGTGYNFSAEKLGTMNRLLTDCDQTLLRVIYPKIETAKE